MKDVLPPVDPETAKMDNEEINELLSKIGQQIDSLKRSLNTLDKEIERTEKSVKEAEELRGGYL